MKETQVIAFMAFRAAGEIKNLETRLSRPISVASEEWVRNRIEEKKTYIVACSEEVERLLQ